MNHQNVNHNPERISHLKPFTNNYSSRDIEFPSHSKDWRKFERNNKTIVLNIYLYLTKKTHQNKILKKQPTSRIILKKQTTCRIILKNNIMSEIILKKYGKHTYQNIIINVIIK